MEYSVKQIAELLDVSKPTIQKKVVELDLKPVRIDSTNRCRYYAEDDTRRVISKIKPNYDFSRLHEAAPSEPTAIPDFRGAQNLPPSVEITEREYQVMIESLQDKIKYQEQLIESLKQDKINLSHDKDFLEGQLEEKKADVTYYRLLLNNQLSIEDKSDIIESKDEPNEKQGKSLFNRFKRKKGGI